MTDENSVSGQLKRLVSLQEVDLQRFQISKNQSAVPPEIAEFRAQIKKIQESKEAIQADYDEVSKVQSQLMAAIEMNQDRRTRADSKLEAVSDNKEYQAATKEVDQLKKQKEELDAKKAEIQGKFDSLNAEMEGYDKQIAEIQTKLEEEEKKQGDVLKGLEGEMERLTSQREEIAQHIGKPLLSRYDRVRKARAGLGVVPVVGGRCKGCNMMIPPQLFNEVQKLQSFHNCPSCQRILCLTVDSGSSDSD